MAADVPNEYQQQIQNTDFIALSSQLNSFILTTALPPLNQLLATGFQLPQAYTQYVSTPLLQFRNEFIFVAADIVNPNSL